MQDLCDVFKNQLLCISLIVFVAALQFSVTRVYAAGNDDSNKKEIGVWGVEDYSQEPYYGNLNWAREEAMGFYNKMVEKGFTGLRQLYDGSALEKHFEKPSVGGTDASNADACDFVYFAGHGWTDHFAFGTNNDGQGPNGAYPYEVHCSEVDWGDQDMEWIFISASHSLEQYPYEWNSAFHSPITLHGITGFHHGPDDTWEASHTGEYFVLYATEGGKSIYEAWRDSTMYWQPAQYYGAMYSVYVIYPPPQPTIHYRDEHLPGIGGGMYPDPPAPGGVSIYIEYIKWQCWPP